jgi:long-chain fatty acid transport protein
MKQIRNITVLMCMVLVAGHLFAGGFALTGVGSRATSMGGAFRGLSDDPSAMYWNPAGLGFMDENSVSLGGTFIMPSATWDPTGTSVASNPGYEAKEYETEKKLRMFPNAFLTNTRNSRFKFGLGVYIPYGLGTTWDAYKLPGAPMVYSGAENFPKDEMMSSVAVVDVHPTVAYHLLPNLSIGAGLSAMYGMIDIAQIKFPASPNAPLTSDLSGAGFGFGANMGIMFKPTECMSIGISGKLPSTIAMEGDAEVFLWMPAQAPIPEMTLGGESDIEADLKLPGEIGIGIASTRIPNLTLTLDYAYTMWDRLDKVIVEMTDPIVITDAMVVSESELVFDWENTHRVSLGGEYAMGMNKLRLGFFYDQTPIPEETQIPTLSDVSDKFSSNIGWGIDLGKIGVEANAQWVMFSEREIGDADATPNNIRGNTVQTPSPGTWGLATNSKEIPI